MTQPTRALHNLVGGESSEAVDGRTAELFDPSTGVVFATATVSGDADV